MLANNNGNRVDPATSGVTISNGSTCTVSISYNICILLSIYITITHIKIFIYSKYPFSITINSNNDNNVMSSFDPNTHSKPILLLLLIFYLILPTDSLYRSPGK